VRLVEVAREYGAGAAQLVDRASEVEDSWLVDVSTVGVTSGASVPEVLVTELLAHLGSRGFADVEVVTSATETLIFSLPKELRQPRRIPS
jgi:4-hydroxy-3-methylbut-2-enyl diphosphate reductase